MNKTLIIAVMCLLATGCGRVVVEGKYIEQAIDLCAENGGVESIDLIKHYLPNYQCNNGAGFEIFNDSISKSSPTKEVVK